MLNIILGRVSACSKRGKAYSAFFVVNALIALVYIIGRVVQIFLSVV